LDGRMGALPRTADGRFGTIGAQGRSEVFAVVAERSGGTRGRTATLEMVAAAAGVGRGTASRALNGSPNVSPRAREAVQRAARELNYRPNLTARSLVTGRTGLVGLVVNESDDRVFADPYFATVLRGAHDVFTKADAALVLTLVEDERERERLFDLVGTRLDGVLVVYGHGDATLRTGLRATGAPVVYGGRTPAFGDSDESWVDADSVHGAMVAVEHLLGRGRRRIVTVTGPQEMAAGLDRLAGWRHALRAAGINPPAAWVEVGTFTEESGSACMRRLLERVPDLDGVFLANDLMAFGAIRALRAAGRRVPDDVSVVGFDDIAAAAYHDPPLTTVSQEIEQMGRTLAETLLVRLNGDHEAHQIVLPTHLVVRESS
jgi:DNA-binding LacI/PurR family transcriptional regulator